MKYLLIFFVSFVLTVVLTPFFSAYIKKLKIVDIPGGRHLHANIVPRMGGFVIFAVAIGVLNAFVDDFASVQLLIISVVILLFCGILDDILGLSSLNKLVFQIVSAGLMVLYLKSRFSSILLFGITFEYPYYYFILILFIVGSINAINLLDGLDGLASGFSVLIFSIILAMSFIVRDSFLSVLCCTLIGGILGFLRFNAHPATVFLGDTGSLALGYFLTFSSIMIALDINKTCLDLTIASFLLAVPLIDTVRVFIQRILKKKNPFSPDTTHLHHIIFKSNVKHEITVFIIELFTLLFLLLSMVYFKGYYIPANLMFFALGTVLISVRPIFGFFEGTNAKEKYEAKLVSAASISHNIFDKTRALLSGFVVIMILFFSFPLHTILQKSEIISLVLALLVLLFLFFFHQIKTEKIPKINVLLNFLIYFILSKLNGSVAIFETNGIAGIGTFHDLSFYALTVLIILAILRQRKPDVTKEAVFTGLDLTLIALILLLFFINKALFFDFNFRLSISLMEAFLFYAFYKVMAGEYQKFEVYFSYLSFLLPICALLF